jgi:hypothetical protein
MLAVLFLIPGLAHATPCNENCTFIRGDVNCDGAVNLTDFIALNQGNITNFDAADVNDSGTVDEADIDHLAEALFGSGADPVCPYPSAGKDCTADNLETCCSKPSAAQNTLPTSGCSPSVAYVSGFPWDHHAESTGALSGGICWGRTVVQNITQSCSHGDSRAEFDVKNAAVDDITFFTKKRLQHGIQTATLHVVGEAFFNHGAVCDDSICVGTNLLVAEWLPPLTTVDVHARPRAGGSHQTVSKEPTGSAIISLSRSRVNGVCTLTRTGNLNQVFNAQFDITNDLKAFPPNDCDEWEIVEIDIEDANLTFFKNNNADISTIPEKIDFKMYAYVTYGWCAPCS